MSAPAERAERVAALLLPDLRSNAGRSMTRATWTSYQNAFDKVGAEIGRNSAELLQKVKRN